MSRLVIIRDETLRDGAQQPGINLTSHDREELALISAQILGTGDKFPRNELDLGMPEVSEIASRNIRDLAAELNKDFNLDFFVTGRASKEAVDAMCGSLSLVPKEKRIIAPFIGISKTHRQKLSLSKEEVLAKIVTSLEYAGKYVDRIHFPLEGGFYAYLEERDYVYDIFKVLTKFKVETVPFCDTIGTALPDSYAQAISDLRQKFPMVGISVHCHDDLGLAVANTVSGLLAGAEVADGSYFGIGERAGNTCLQSLLVLLRTHGDKLGLEVEANLQGLYPLSQKMKRILKVNLPDNYPVVGKNSFTHASGIHQDGILKFPEVYEPYNPQDFGRKHEISLSYLSGKRGIDYILRKKLHLSLPETELEEVTKEFKESSDSPLAPLEQLKQIIQRRKTAS